MKNFITVAIIIFGLMFFAHGLYARFGVEVPQAQGLVVVELFTSQSCSSCPPADKVLAQLAVQDNVIALGCHVSYWDHLHWKDTLGHEFCNVRQHGYNAYSGTKRVYTPQMIVNGQYEFVGSRYDQLVAAFKRTENAPLDAVHIKAVHDTITFTLPELTRGAYRLWAFGYRFEHHQDILKGENRNLSVTYAHPIVSYINLGAWDGERAQHQFDRPAGRIDALAIIVQEGGYGPIIAAGKLAL